VTGLRRQEISGAAIKTIAAEGYVNLIIRALAGANDIAVC
jgi:hypothetical protein